MFDRPPAARGAAAPDAAADDGARWAQCLAMALDAIDHGVVLLGRDGAVRRLNPRAQQELDDDHPLQLSDGQIAPRRAADAGAWRAAVAAPHPHRLLTLGDGAQRVSVALQPLGDAAVPEQQTTMLLLGRRRAGAGPVLPGFATHRALTRAETRVLEALCAGTAPARIAQALGVRLSTVRTQIASLRQKTGAHSIPDLVRHVALLPPLRPLGTAAAVQAT